MTNAEEPLRLSLRPGRAGDQETQTFIEHNGEQLERLTIQEGVLSAVPSALELP